MHTVYAIPNEQLFTTSKKFGFVPSQNKGTDSILQIMQNLEREVRLGWTASCIVLPLMQYRGFER